MGITPIILEELLKEYVRTIPRLNGRKVVNAWVNDKGNLVIEFEE